MKKLNDVEIKKCCNDILLYIKTVCEANQIQFFLAYGTVLGAVRHHGFIPWDDDIDIYMTRKNYEMFKRVMSKMSSPYYKVYDVYNNDNYFMPLSKVVDIRTTMKWHVAKKQTDFGAWVDVYVLDNVPDSKIRLWCFHKSLNFLQRCYEHSLYKRKIVSFKSIIRNFLFSWTNIFGPRNFSKIMVRLSQKYNKENTAYFAPSSFTAQSRKQAVLSKKTLGKGTIVEFEKHTYLAPEKIDEYLTHFYGNYMELPPIEKRKPNHTADFYLRENETIMTDDSSPK